MSQNRDRRQLRFNDLDEVVRDAETLLAKGYQKAGNWDLAQCCKHLAEWMRFPVEGFPKAPAADSGDAVDDEEDGRTEEVETIHCGRRFPGRQADDATNGRGAGQ